ncbi:hypothetical protein I3760_10G121800 [Carya illinoinensis]|nr:hypothetical protein I3760_10G121800 [Carya illinoinensis]
MAEQQQPLRVEDDGREHSSSSPRWPTTLTLPLTRNATSLTAADRCPVPLADYSEPPSDDLHSSDESGFGYYYYFSYSKPILVLDLVWNLAFLIVAVVVLLSTFEERPSTPLRVWLCGYSLQCVLHVSFVYLEYLKRVSSIHDRAPQSPLRSPFFFTYTSILKKMESVNTMLSSIWWVFGFYWIVMGGQELLQDSPRLYWLTVVFLAFDVFFIIFCIGTAFIIFFALCCCIPLVAFAYAMTIRQGASEDDIRSLPKYRFCQANPLGTFDNDKMKVAGARMESVNSNYTNERPLHPEDSECCICLSQYVDGVELYTLPCNHHFHCGCISRWLRINATCPLCKFNILRGDTLV